MAPLLAGDALMRVSPDGGRTFPAWWEGGGRRKREVVLSARLPNEPVTVPVFHVKSGTGRKLVLDFDVSKAERLAGVADPVGRVALEAAACSALLEGLGFRPVADRSPAGGRHLYVLLAQALPWTELRDAVRALALRFPTLDVSPMMSVGGQIRVPGSGHKLSGGRLTGWMALTMPLEQAAAAARSPAGPAAWNALQTELTAAYTQLGMGGFAPASADPEVAGLPHDDDGMPWLPRVSGARPASPYYEAIAVSGVYDTSRYPSGHEARWAVLWSCARRGWRLSEVVARVESGQWAGLWQLYGKRNRGGRARGRAMESDWRKAITEIAKASRAEDPGRKGDTSRITSRAPHGQPHGQDAGCGLGGELLAGGTRRSAVRSKVDLVLNEWQLIAQFQNAVWAAERDPDQRAAWGREAGANRRVLRALMVASRLARSTTTGFGVRYLALISKLPYRLVAKVLRRLREADDPFVDHVALHHHDEPDLYMLRTPDRYRELAVWRRWRAGLIPAIHCAFRRLSGPCAFVYEALDDVPAGAAQIGTSAAVSSSAATDALRELAVHGLAVRVPGTDGGWVRGPVTLDAVAVSLGADTEDDDLADQYARERREWKDILASLAATPDLPGGEQADPDPGQAAAIADLLAQTQPPDDRPGPADDLPDHIPDHIPDPADPAEHDQAGPDPLAWMHTPGHQAAMQALADLGQSHPLADKLRERGPKKRTTKKKAAKKKTAGRRRSPTPAPALPPLVPMPAIEQDALVAGDPVLQLLVDQLGAVLLTPATTRGGPR